MKRSCYAITSLAWAIDSRKRVFGANHPDHRPAVVHSIGEAGSPPYAPQCAAFRSSSSWSRSGYRRREARNRRARRGTAFFNEMRTFIAGAIHHRSPRDWYVVARASGGTGDATTSAAPAPCSPSRTASRWFLQPPASVLAFRLCYRLKSAALGQKELE